VLGDRVIVTSYSGYGIDQASPGDQKNLARQVVCLNLGDGKVKWQKSVPAVLPEDRFASMLASHGYASSTPAADADRVYVFFGKSGVLAYDWDGKELWHVSVGTDLGARGWGSGTSLTLYKNLVIVNANAESQSLVALDKATGRQIWKAEAKGYAGSWSTPTLVDVGGKQELVVNMPGEIWGLNPEDGGLLWYSTALGSAANTSIAAKDGIVYAIGGGPSGSGVVAIRAGGRDDVTESHTVWKKSVGSYVPSPVIVGEHLYWVDDRGFAYCLKTGTGEQVYRERIPDAGGAYASVIATKGKLYAPTRRNGTFVLAAAPKFEVLARNQFESDASDFNASPAIVDGRLLLRSNRFLYCIGKK
jgi:hypothetical protein